MASQDLSQAQGRQTVTDRTVGNIQPSKLALQDPAPQLTLSMRDANRGTPEADAVRQALGLIDEAKSNMIDLSQKQFQQSELKNAQVASRDFATGKVDPNALKTSEAYRMVIADGRVHQALTMNANAIHQGVMEALNAGATADPTKGEHPFTLDDANAKFDEMIKPLLLDKDGKPIDYGDPHANVTLYQSVAKLRANVLQQAADTIKTQEQQKAMDAIGNMAITDLSSGKSTAIEDGIAKAKALGIDPTVAKKTLMHSVLDSAMQTKDASLINKVLFSTQSDGSTPTWNPQEKGELMQAYTTFSHQWEAEKRIENERKSNENMGRMFPDILSGKVRLTADAIQALIAKGPENGGISPDQATNLFQMQNAVDSRKQTEIQIARGNQQWAWAQQEHAQAAQAKSATNAVIATKAMFYSGQLTPEQAISQLDTQYRTHQLDDHTYLSTREALMTLPTGKVLVSRSGAQAHLDVLNESFGQAEKWIGRPGYPSQQQWLATKRQAQAAFYTSLATSNDPDSALANALGTWVVKKDAVQHAVFTASHRQSGIDIKQKIKNAQLDASK
jgi:hypothetical protein